MINMAQLTKYQDFLERVDELGFMPLSHLMPGLTSLGAETPGKIWHTGDAETDPWRWKDRAAEEKRLAYGCILGGHKGFVSARMYALFYVACHPADAMPERWAAGVVSQSTWQLWRLFEKWISLDTSQVRREMGVTPKSGGSRVDASLKELQQQYSITVAGSRRKVGQDGQPYGWPACIYERVFHWAPADWMRKTSGVEPGGACETILDTGVAMGKNIDRDELARKLGLY